jgi:carbamoyl-phosphate synthase large subunit
MRSNILITSAVSDGRLFKAFRRELHALLPNGSVLRADARPDRPAYAQRLLDACVSDHVGLVVPTADLELTLLARHLGQFASNGVMIAVSDPPIIDMTHDKRALADWFRQRGLQTPRPINSRFDATFPIVAISNGGVFRRTTVTDAAQFASLMLDDPQLVFTEYLPPAAFEEYTVDLYYSEDGTLTFALLRQYVDGDLAGPSAPPSTITGLRERFAQVPGARGRITMQLCVEQRTGAIYGLNAKAGLDDDCPLESGSRIVRQLIQDYLLEKTGNLSRRRAA